MHCKFLIMNRYFKHSKADGTLEFLRVTKVQDNRNMHVADIEVKPLNPNYRFGVTNDMTEITRHNFLDLMKEYNLGLPTLGCFEAGEPQKILRNL